MYRMRGRGECLDLARFPQANAEFVFHRSDVLLISYFRFLYRIISNSQS